MKKRRRVMKKRPVFRLPSQMLQTHTHTNTHTHTQTHTHTRTHTQ
jgi:hypothetical protein